jgi:putative N6-adenine-specific DNA methylase
VSFDGDLQAVYRANLHLRTASRLLARLGEFRATSFAELRKKAGLLGWEAFLAPGQPAALHVTCRKSKLYHSEAVAERVAGAIGDRLGKPAPLHKAAADEDSPAGGEPAQLVIVRFLNDICTISVDSSGALLHRRGYRLATAKAPLRATLAAGLLAASGWDRAAPLLDPFCGSGTIPIEAALMAAGIPPGWKRRFAFMDWPGFDARAWQALLGEVRPRLAGVQILASDRDAGAAAMAQANAERAGVAGMIAFSQRAVSAIEPPAGPGWVVTNPPYGLRVSGGKDLRNLYAQFGNVLRARCPGWQTAILCSDVRLLGQTGVKLDTSLRLVNGGVSVVVGRGSV